MMSVGQVLPTKISNLFAWYDANKLGLTDGTLIGSWTDMSGNNNHAIQASVGSKPTFKVNIVNGLPSVFFNGNNVKGPAFTASNYTIFVVYIATIISATACFVSNDKSSPSRGLTCIINNSANIGLVDSTDGTTTTTITITPASIINNIGLAVYQNSGLAISMRNNVNSGILETKNNLVMPHFNNSNGIAIGARPDVGGAPLLYTGYICEVVIYSRSLNDSEKGNIEQYLKYKWGI